MSINPRNILGVSADATEKEIKAAYKKLAKKYHPDVNGGDKAAESKFKEINEAYTMLTEKKAAPNYQAGNFDFQEFFNESMFNHIFRAGGSARTINRVRVDPRMLIIGGTFDYAVQMVENRGGRLHPVHRTVKITVEPDTPVMAQIAVPGTEPHYVYLQLMPGDTDIYRVSSDMIHLTQTHQIGAFRAMVGSEVEVTAPNGKQMKFSIPPGTQNGAIHRLRGLGLRTPDGRRGDYNVQFTILIPAITGADDEELKKNLLENLEMELKQ